MDITSANHGNNPLSMEAHQSIISHKEHLRAKVLAYIDSQGYLGATSDEVEAALGLSHQSVSARFTELKALHRIVDAASRRPTRSGRNASVWVTPGQSVLI